MPIYKFTIDKKCTVWVREFHEVEADSIKEAEEIILKDKESYFYYQETQYDTLEDTDVYEITNEETGDIIETQNT